MKKSLSDLWVEACLELWELSENRPYLRDASLWDAFRFAYMRSVNEDRPRGRWALGEG